MKRTYQAAFLMLALAPASLFAQAGTAAAAGTTKVGVIDIQTAILATNEGQRDFNTLTTKFQPKQTELQNMSKEVDDLQKQLDTQGDKLNEETKNNMIKQLEQRKKTLQRTYDDAQSDFEAQKNDILKNLGNKVYQTLNKYATDNGFTVIVDVSNPQSPVLWAAPSTNITKAIVDAYNVTSGVPAPAAPAAKPASAPATTRPPATSH